MDWTGTAVNSISDKIGRSTAKFIPNCFALHRLACKLPDAATAKRDLQPDDDPYPPVFRSMDVIEVQKYERYSQENCEEFDLHENLCRCGALEALSTSSMATRSPLHWSRYLTTWDCPSMSVGRKPWKERRPSRVKVASRSREIACFFQSP
ncbi:hypothetical protein MIND_00497600 [Mycena indigotica]|uniref:Uncharacterized protein n=1 Tax=Mycena indigotica TaxID=2126181 RepID=A0A8H6T051_9AGAR|nr:uncharacterized protein MIND_00497600 [Mycena indigotica]KAF7307045.1 hypothetical protein MIND_00497600 [Mycena indigotica]